METTIENGGTTANNETIKAANLEDKVAKNPLNDCVFLPDYGRKFKNVKEAFAAIKDGFITIKDCHFTPPIERVGAEYNAEKKQEVKESMLAYGFQSWKHTVVGVFELSTGEAIIVMIGGYNRSMIALEIAKERGDDVSLFGVPCMPRGFEDPKKAGKMIESIKLPQNNEFIYALKSEDNNAVINTFQSSINVVVRRFASIGCVRLDKGTDLAKFARIKSDCQQPSLLLDNYSLAKSLIIQAGVTGVSATSNWFKIEGDLEKTEIFNAVYSKFMAKELAWTALPEAIKSAFEGEDIIADILADDDNEDGDNESDDKPKVELSKLELFQKCIAKSEANFAEGKWTRESEVLAIKSHKAILKHTTEPKDGEEFPAEFVAEVKAKLAVLQDRLPINVTFELTATSLKCTFPDIDFRVTDLVWGGLPEGAKDGKMTAKTVPIEGLMPETDYEFFVSQRVKADPAAPLTNRVKIGFKTLAINGVTITPTAATTTPAAKDTAATTTPAAKREVFEAKEDAPTTAASFDLLKLIDQYGASLNKANPTASLTRIGLLLKPYLLAKSENAFEATDKSDLIKLIDEISTLEAKAKAYDQLDKVIKAGGNAQQEAKKIREGFVAKK